MAPPVEASLLRIDRVENVVVGFFLTMEFEIGRLDETQSICIDFVASDRNHPVLMSAYEKRIRVKFVFRA